MEIISTAYLMGGLGNLLFQISHAVCQGWRNNIPSCFLPTSHTPMQAEQCVLIAHNVGKCAIKEGNILEMIEMKTGLEKCELITEIENYESYMH